MPTPWSPPNETPVYGPRVRTAPGRRSSPRTPAGREGFTFVDLLIALSVVAILLSLATPVLRRVVDRAAVVSAREGLLALVHRARAEAPRHGGAELRLSPDGPRAELATPTGEVLGTLDLVESGVALRLSGRTEPDTLRWNRLGWGIVTSRTLLLIRGADSAALVVSSRGRARRR